MTAIVIVLSCFPDVGKTIGMYAGCPWSGRLLYSFAHANFLHAAINCWCLLSITFIYNISWRSLLAAYIIAVSYPSAWMGSTPIVGLSGVCFALLGIVALRVVRKLYYQAWIVCYLLIGFMFPNAAAWLHVYCYILGLFVALLNMPLPRKGGFNGKR